MPHDVRVSESSSRRTTLIVSAVTGLVAIGVRVAVESGSQVGGLAAAAGAAVLIGVFGRHQLARARSQVAKIVETGVFKVEAGLDPSSLPDPWPHLVMLTLNPAGAGRMTAVPCTISAPGSSLRIEKATTWSSGRTPFAIDVPLDAIAVVDADGPELAIIGTRVSLALRNGEELRLHLPLPRRRGGDEVVRQLAALTTGTLAAEPSPVVISSGTPPRRTSAGRAFLMLVLSALPLPAMFVVDVGDFAIVGPGAVALAALALLMNRPGRMHRWLAWGHAVAGVGLAVAAAATGRGGPLLGAAACLAAGAACAAVGPGPDPWDPPAATFVADDTSDLGGDRGRSRRWLAYSSVAPAPDLTSDGSTP